MARIREGDAAALDSLMTAHWHRLIAYASRFLDSADAAEDVAQETFVRLWERRTTFELSGSVRCYLYQVARNLIRDEGRKGRVRTRWAATGPHLRPMQADPAQELEAEDLREAVNRGIQALPARRREVFVLAHFHDLTYRQIAEILHISPQTVANQMSSALADLRRTLAPFLLRPVRVALSGSDASSSPRSFRTGFAQSKQA